MAIYLSSRRSPSCRTKQVSAVSFERAWEYGGKWHRRESEMEKLKIAGGYPLKGTVRISGAKNSAVALIPATILADSPVTIEGLPDISDVEILKDLLEEIGGTVRLSENDM